MKCGALILAAGKSRRMRIGIPKVLLPVCGVPAINLIIERINKLKIPSVVVLGYKADEVKKVMSDEVEVVVQEEQKGNAHAVYLALDKIKKFDRIVLLYGDVPLIETATIKKMLSQKADCVLLTKELDAPSGYGRVIRDTEGNIVGIKEEQELSPSEKKVREVNLGVYVFSVRKLETALPVVMKRRRRDGEYYITDVIEVISKSGGKIEAMTPLYEWEGDGMNTPQEYSSLLLKAYAIGRKKALKNGCVILGEDVFISPFSKIRGAIIHNGVRIDGKSKIEGGVLIEEGCIIKDTVIKKNSHIKPYSVIEGAIIGEGCTVGPFARLREGTKLRKNVKIGNFVEVKKSLIEDGVKAQHLSYIGDAFIGRETNIGAGTITCNYDGFRKNKTYIGRRVFVGSDVQFVAPVRIGNCAWIGAGSTITKDVPPYALGITRAEQKVVKDYAKRKKKCAE